MKVSFVAIHPVVSFLSVHTDLFLVLMVIGTVAEN